MQIRIKATGFSLTPSLEELCREKLLGPLEKRLGNELPSELPLDVELAKTTRHHGEGMIWKCEVNLALPKEKRTIYAEVLGESIEAAIDLAKDDLEREVDKYKGKNFSKFIRAARQLKRELRITRLARRAARGAGDVYRWFRRK